MKRARAGLLLACLWLLAGCAGPAAPPRLSPGDAAPVIKIGVIAPFEGLGRPLGYAVLSEANAVVAAANADGRLGPYRVALVALNDELDPASAASQAAAISLDPEIVAVLGPFTSATAAAAAPVLTAAHVPVLLAAPAADLAGARALCPPPAAIAAALDAVAVCSSCSHSTIDNQPERPIHQTQALRAAGRASLSAYRGQDGRVSEVFFPGEAAAAADALIARRAEGWAGALLGGPDLLKPWFVGRAGEAGEGTRAVACVLPGAEPEDGLPEAALARGGARLILDAIAELVAQGRQPDRATVSAALASAEIAPSLAWYEVRGGEWVKR